MVPQPLFSETQSNLHTYAVGWRIWFTTVLGESSKSLNVKSLWILFSLRYFRRMMDLNLTKRYTRQIAGTNDKQHRNTGGRQKFMANPIWAYSDSTSRHSSTQVYWVLHSGKELNTHSWTLTAIFRLLLVDHPNKQHIIHLHESIRAQPNRLIFFFHYFLSVYLSLNNRYQDT